jgi:NACHT domain
MMYEIDFIKSKLGSPVDTLSSSDRRCCLNTRQAILRDITGWITENPGSGTAASIFWMMGAAGSGKSTISRNVVDITKEMGIPCANFFFSRDSNDRRKPDQLITTLALGLVSSREDKLITSIYDALQKPGLDHSTSLHIQFEKLLHAPLKAADCPAVLVLDALDEYTDAESSAEVLSLLDKLSELPRSTKVFFTSRPESDLKRVQDRLAKKGSVFCHDLTFNPNKEGDFTLRDIETYLKYRFGQMINEGYSWLDYEVLDPLINIIDGLFMIAEFVYILIRHPDGKRRLDSLLAKRTYADGGSSTKRLYDFYSKGLQQIFVGDSKSEKECAKTIMSAVLVVQYPLSKKALATLLGHLGVDEQSMDIEVERLSPYLAVDVENASTVDRPVRFIHKSISDFFVSPHAGDLQINLNLASANLAIPCLQLLCDELPKAFKLLSSASRTSSLQDQNGLESRISEVLVYACEFWGYHLKDATTLDESLEGPLRKLLFSHLLEWLHIMGRMKRLDAALSCLRLVEKWEVYSAQCLRCCSAELIHSQPKPIMKSWGSFTMAFASYKRSTIHLLETGTPVCHYISRLQILSCIKHIQQHSPARLPYCRGCPTVGLPCSVPWKGIHTWCAPLRFLQTDI